MIEADLLINQITDADGTKQWTVRPLSEKGASAIHARMYPMVDTKTPLGRRVFYVDVSRFEDVMRYRNRLLIKMMETTEEKAELMARHIVLDAERLALNEEISSTFWPEINSAKKAGDREGLEKLMAEFPNCTKKALFHAMMAREFPTDA